MRVAPHASFTLSGDKHIMSHPFSRIMGFSMSKSEKPKPNLALHSHHVQPVGISSNQVSIKLILLVHNIVNLTRCADFTGILC